MKNFSSLRVWLVLSMALCALTVFIARVEGKQTGKARGPEISADDIGGVVTSAKGPRSGSLGHCGNQGSAHALHQDCSYRRFGALSLA